ncbi:MAG: hypothetical protein ACRDTX_29205 [Pseudonocardiaceae bacterium]
MRLPCRSHRPRPGSRSRHQPQWRGGHGYVTGHLPDDEQLPLCRLRYLGSDTEWGFALYQASSEAYDDTLLPNGNPSGTPEQALDCALGLYLADPSSWINPPKD